MSTTTDNFLKIGALSNTKSYETALYILKVLYPFRTSEISYFTRSCIFLQKTWPWGPSVWLDIKQISVLFEGSLKQIRQISVLFKGPPPASRKVFRRRRRTPPKDISKQHELENRAVSDIIDKPKSAARVSNNRVSYDVALNNT